MKKKNSHGIAIEMCCMSCKHSTIIMDDWRRCHRGKEKTPMPMGACCIRWKMKKGLEAAGEGGGKVKRRTYQEFFIALIERWDAKSGMPYPSVREARQLYREKFKEDIYINI